MENKDKDKGPPDVSISKTSMQDKKEDFSRFLMFKILEEISEEAASLYSKISIRT